MSPLDDHFHHPRNAGVLPDADLHVEVENPVCGDVLHLYLRRDGAGRVMAARFQVYGCPAAIAAGSLLTELVSGLTRSELRSLKEERINEALGGLAAQTRHAAVLAADAVEKAAHCWGGDS